MANADLSVRFTDEQYASKLDVMRALNTSLIDSIWRNIEEYRGRFARLLSLRDIAKSPLKITFAPNIVDKITNMERKLTRAMIQYGHLEMDSPERDVIKRDCYVSILQCVAREINLEPGEDAIHRLIDGESGDARLAPLENYYRALVHFEKHHLDPIDENFLADIYALLKGESELVSFYRERDFSRPTQVVIGREYNFAPVGMIEFLMRDLLDFITNSEISFVVKAIAAYYFIDYVKPFEMHNEEIAIFLMKSVLSHNDIAEVSAFIPLESLLVMRNENFRKIFLEVQKTNDLTYALIAATDLLLAEVEKFLDKVTRVKVTAAKKEFNAIDIQAPVEKKPEPKAAVVEPKKVEKAEPEPRIEAQLSIPKSPAVLDENGIQQIAQSLLESDPHLRSKQAEFYARHCTIGKYYTISQYKKEMDVVYETARTSMDNLAKLGYYRREMIKTKFVYTPIGSK